eukprot:1126326-Pelagomonas_calceolata.AAC.1
MGISCRHVQPLSQKEIIDLHSKVHTAAASKCSGAHGHRLLRAGMWFYGFALAALCLFNPAHIRSKQMFWCTGAQAL